MTMTVDKVLYTGQARTTGGRNGASQTRSHDQKARLARAIGPGGSDLSRCGDRSSLGTCEARRATLLNCSPYIRDQIGKERD
jgi:hypothetical protein